MVCRINTGAKPSGAVYYNEDKVANGEARFLRGVNAIAFKRGAISAHQKMAVLERYMSMNPRISKPTFHASLAFHPSEQLSDDKLLEIGQQYMDRLGYGNQPYLVYRHEDTHHPHIHIVSVSVDYEGKRISESHQHRRSNAIRQALEKEHGLVQAEKQGKAVLMDGLLPEQMLAYKEPEAKKAIGNVVQTAMKDYRFSSIDTFSAFLHQHRVQLNQLSGVGADGNPYRGITFQLSDWDGDRRGQPIGPAIKASRFSFAPTIDRLEQQFSRSQGASKAGQDTTRRRIGKALNEYDKVSEADFKTALRAQGVQVLETGQRFIYVDHKSRTVYDEQELGELFRRERWQQSFVRQSKPRQQPPLPQAVAEATATKTGLLKTNKPPKEAPKLVVSKPAGEIVPPVVEPGADVAARQIQTPARPMTAGEQTGLRRQVSQAYQQLRTEGVAAAGGPPQDPVYFESQLIARFPHQQLTDALVSQGVRPDDARQAVTNFETYKQGQLPDIRAKEQRYFEQTTDLLVKLAQTMPINATSRQAFLLSMELDLAGFNIRHRQHDALYYPLSLAQQGELRNKQGVALAFPRKANKPTRRLYLAIADDQPAPPGVSYYQVGAYHLLKGIGPTTFQRIAPSLNINYLTQLQAHVDAGTKAEKPSLLVQLASRGIVVKKEADGTYRAGHTLSGEATFAPLGETISARLSQAFLPPLAVQRSAQQTPAVRQLVRLSQALDLQDETAVRRVSEATRKNYSLTDIGTGLTVQQTLQQVLENLYAPPAPAVIVKETPTARQAVVPGVNGASVPGAVPPTRVAASAYGLAIVDMLLKAELNPAERGVVASQLGLQWQTGTGGRIQVVEQAGSPQPGAIYELSTHQRQHIEPTSNQIATGGQPARDISQLNGEDRLLMAHWLGGKPLSSITFTGSQIARLQVNRLVRVMGTEQQHAFETWYNGARGTDIINQRVQQAEKTVSARRYLSDLYQRGFVVHQSVTSGGKPHYRMGAIGLDVSTYAALPDWLSQQVETVTTPLKPAQRAGVFLIEGGWCKPTSKTAGRMQRLARALDGEQPTGVQAAISLIQKQYPALRPVMDTSILLDALASQSPARLQQAKPIAMEGYELEAALNKVSRQQVQNAYESFQSLGILSVVKGVNAVVEQSGAVTTTKLSVGEAVNGRNQKPG